MGKPYSSEVCRRLAEAADAAGLHRRRRLARHEAGDVLTLDLTGVAPAWKARATFELERYVGGGFAGQVYRARLRGVEADGGPALPLQVGGVYALKMFVPWSRFVRGFRNTLYAAGFQAPFGLQVNPSAVRACALWHKLIRRGAGVRLGGESAVVDVHATFFDEALGSMGEVLEWVDGRVWRLEVNDRQFFRTTTRSGPPAEAPQTGEYEAKRRFMARLVALFHEMGAPELARQYEWWTLKSQPNVLKRHGRDDDPEAGLVAVDFGAGLALLPFLPMSPADVALILKGLAAGRVVQFDRGDLARLEAFVAAHPREFTDLGGAVAELRLAERGYHGSQLDLANHPGRALVDRDVRRAAREGWARGYAVRGLMDGPTAARMGSRPGRLLVFILLGLVPLAGRFLQRLWGSASYRRHVGAMLTSLDYLGRALRAKAAETLIEWHRRGRVGAERALALAAHPLAFWAQALTLGLLPAGLHRFLTDPRYAWDMVRHVAVRPFVLYFSRARREQWLREMVEEGRADGVLKPADADRILARLHEPYIQTYLFSLVVHLFTIPITQVVSVVLGYYLAAKYGHDAVESGAIFGSIVVLFQLTPISPGSITRGLYATGVMFWKRDWKNYSWAVCISYWKYIGYLGFPIQMLHTYPDLATFMATRWATHAISIVPVFGERGALLEHAVFSLFFNAPVSLRRQWREEAPARAALRNPAGRLGTLLGVGCLPGPSGTYASLVTAGLMAAAWYLGAPPAAVAAAALIVTAVGIPAAGRCERRTGAEDPRVFVLDEVAGMLLAGLAAWLPWNRWAWASLAAAFFWFRVTDVLKPPPARQLERLPGGWGILADDVAAGLQALGLTILTQLVLGRFLGAPPA